MQHVNDTDHAEHNSARHSLFLVDRLELNCFIAVLPTASGTTAVQILFDVVPAEATDLRQNKLHDNLHEREVQTW